MKMDKKKTILYCIICKRNVVVDDFDGGGSYCPNCGVRYHFPVSKPITKVNEKCFNCGADAIVEVYDNGESKIFCSNDYCPVYKG